MKNIRLPLGYAFGLSLVIIASLVSLGLPGGFVHGLERVGFYEMFETQIINTKTYSNPFDFRVIELQAIYKSPSGRKILSTGFYDGDGKGGQNGSVWKLRFMPDEVGNWIYEYSWSDRSAGGSGSFVVTGLTNAKNHGHVRVDRHHPRYLAHDDGTPHYWWGGKWISAANYGPASKGGESNPEHYTNEQFLRYLDTLQAYEHNGLLLKVALYPLENDKYSWDLNWIQRAEWLVRQMASRGIYVQISFFDTWSRDRSKWFSSNTDGTRQLFNVWAAGDEDAKRNYIKTLIARFAGFFNVYWELGNEMEHSPNCGSCFVTQANEKYIPWIREHDPYGLPIGLSEGIWRSASVDIGFLHQTTSLPSSSWDRPTIMNELVSGGITGALWRDDAMRDSANRLAYRRTFWRMFTYGGSGSSEATWLNIGNALNQAVLDVMADQQRVKRFSEALPLNINEMDTDDSFVISGPGNHRTRRKQGAAYVTYFLLNPGQSVGEGTVALRLPEGSYESAWYDPSIGSYRSARTVTSGNGIATFSHPSFTEDIVLRILRKDVLDTQAPAVPGALRILRQ